MIYSHINISDKINGYPEAVKRAIEFIKSRDFINISAGELVIEGKDIFARVLDMTLKGADEVFPETHKKYIDVQYWVTGHELVGFVPDTGSFNIEKQDSEHDIYFWGKLEDEVFLPAGPGSIMIFFPGDIHRPGVIAGNGDHCRKIVVKISTDLI